MFKVYKDFSGANVPRTIRFTDDMFSELNEVAAKEKVSLNRLVLLCCRYALDNMETKEKQ